MTKPKPEDAVTNGDLKRMFKWQDIAVVLAILGSTVTGYIALVNTAHAQALDGDKPLQAQIDVLASRIDKAEKDAGAIRADMREVQADIRLLYKAVMTGAKQERLEHPPVDGGGVP